MEDDKQKRLREIAFNINTAIAEAAQEVSATKDQARKDILIESLTDLQRGWLHLNEKPREK